MSIQQIKSGVIADSAIVAAKIASINAAVISAGTLPGARLPAGSVLQVVSATKTDTFTTTSSSFVDLTGVSVSITPTSTSSKIMIIATLMAGADAVATTFMSRLVRNSTAIALGDAAGSRAQVTFGTDNWIDAFTNFSIALTFLDSPSTTSSTTYKVQVANTRAAGGTLTVNRDGADTNDVQVPRGSSTITVMEIAG